MLRRRFCAVREMMTHVAAFTLDGRPFGELPVRVRGPSRHKIRLAPKDAEFEVAARALVRLGERKAAFLAGERPDWHVKLGDGRSSARSRGRRARSCHIENSTSVSATFGASELGGNPRMLRPAVSR